MIFTSTFRDEKNIYKNIIVLSQEKDNSESDTETVNEATKTVKVREKLY